MSKKDKGIKYNLTIVYNPDEDQCEYIQEEIVDETDTNTSWLYGDLDLEDYFSDSDISSLTCCIIGKT